MVSSLESNYELSQINYTEEERKSKRMTKRIRTLENDLTMEKPLRDIREILWTNIIDSINDIWSFIQIIFEQTELVKLATEAIKKTREELVEKPEETTQLINFFNSKSKQHLEQWDIEDMSGTILEIKKVLTKKNLMLNLERRCQSIQEDIDDFMLKYDILRDKALPSPMVINDKLMNHGDYVEKLHKQAKSQASSSTLKALPTGKVLYDGLENLFYIEHEVKHLFTVQPNFEKYTEADEVYKKLIRMKIPNEEWWTSMTNIL